LKEVDMSKATSLEMIGNDAFRNCIALVRVKWPPNLKFIGGGAFARCVRVREADMDKLMEYYLIG